MAVELPWSYGRVPSLSGRACSAEPVDAHRRVRAVLRPGDVAVQGHGRVQPDERHRSARRPHVVAQAQHTWPVQGTEQHRGGVDDGGHPAAGRAAVADATSGGVTASLDLTLGAVVRRIRLEIAARLTSTTDLPLSQVARRCGFASAESLRQAFVTAFGISPRAFRQTHARRHSAPTRS
jgi:Helix-turn-helix domain